MSSYDPAIASRIVSSGASNNATSAKASPGFLRSVIGVNATAGVKYLKFYDKATAPNPAADTPVLVFALPASAPFNLGAYDFKFSIGIGYAIVTGTADNDNTAIAAGDILGLNVMII